jgi:hypothetical protein
VFWLPDLSIVEGLTFSLISGAIDYA